jgi:hypothetical protein
MQPFEEKCKGRLSLLALQVLGDPKGVVWMYGESIKVLKRISCACLVRETLFCICPSETYLLMYLMNFRLSMQNQRPLKTPYPYA